MLDNIDEKLLEIAKSSDDTRTKLEKMLEVTDWMNINSFGRRISIKKRNGESNPEYDIFYEFFSTILKSKMHMDYINPYKCSDEEAGQRITTLNDLYELAISDASSEEKLTICMRKFRDFKTFERKYSLIKRYGVRYKFNGFLNPNHPSIDAMFDEVGKLYDNELVRKNIDQRFKYEEFFDEYSYLEDYKYAEWIINRYISDDKSYLRNQFLLKYNISEEVFDYCLKVIKFLNSSLYKKYLDKIEENNIKRSFALKETIKNIANGIKTGVLSDGTPFSKIEFYRRIPFKNSCDNFISILLDYIERNFGVASFEYRMINGYIRELGINKISFINKDKLIQQKISLNGFELTPEVINKVIEYMDNNDLPKISSLFKLLVKEYIKDPTFLDGSTPTQPENDTKCINPFTLIMKKK